MSLFDDDQKSMLDVYLYETNSLFEQLDKILIRTEKSNTFTDEDIRSIFRIMHTTKSSSSMMNLQSISVLMHTAEDLFSFFRDDPQKIINHEKQTFDLLFDISDYMHSQLDQMKDEDYTPEDAQQYILRIQALMNKMNDVKVISDQEEIIEEPADIDNSVYIRISFEEEARMENVRAYMLVMQIKNLCQVLTYYPKELENNPEAAEYIKENGFYITFKATDSQKVLETLYRSLFLKKCEIIDKDEYFIKTQPQVKAMTQKEALENISLEPSSLIPVHVSKLDALQNLIGELIIAESNILTRMEQLNQKELMELFDRHFHKSLLDIEEIVMSSRLVPIAQIVPKLHRVVRDISRKENKDIHFVVKGEEIEIDKEIVDSLFDPLMHLLRNAVDHGIESQAERQSLHKPETGEIVFNIENKNSEIVIHISDDGRGLNLDKIKEKAASKGLIKKDHQYTDEEIYAFIMLPGFSTNQKANEFSGRGVGMDVVKNMVDHFKGHITIESQYQVGTHITLHLPLTLMIIESLLFCVGETVFSISSHYAMQFFAYDQQHIQHENGHYVYVYKDKVLPIIQLNTLFNLHSQKSTSSQILIYVQSATAKACLLVDDIIGYQHIVDKPLPLLLNNTFKKATCISGCSLLGDGRVCMTLNLESLLNMRGEKHG